ncbi:MAG: isoprenylcysteine carboxylmethyltransferase family protein [Steroidobacteraceae bacterium]|nr:isoprenylcysteine carboxylmethyltransferase family protein [Steroidobacteraceae bacterium]
MSQLELRVPPVAVAFLVGIAMFGARALAPDLTFAYPGRAILTAILAVAGVGFALAGVAEFRRAQTTVDPTDPGRSNTVVTSGIYGFSRNPMYLGFLLVLLGWAAYLSSAGTLLGPVLFILYLNRYQILPEERILRSRFGAQYETYVQSVRRWI